MLMRPQIVYETEVHRQHVRLKIPIQVEIDGIRHQVDDWSLGGLAVESVLTSRKPDDRFWVRLIFPFDEFELTMRREARMVYVDQEHGRFGCAFLDVSERHAEVLRYLIDAYLAGELVSAGDLLQVRAGGNTAPARMQAAYAAGADEMPWPASTRYGAYASFALAGLALLAVIAFGIWQRYFAIDALSATIEAPVVEVRAPIAGRFVSALEPGERVLEGAALGRVQALDGATLTLESPCDCRVLDQLALSGLYHQSGDPLVALIPAQQPLMVRAQLALDQAERLGVGDRAEIHVPGRGEPMLGQIARIDFTPALEVMRSRAEPASPRLAEVLIRPDLPFDFQDFGGLVSIRFR
jgi:alginate biosynthesis protein Alg44